MEELKVGDWVRYTRVDALALRDEGEIGQVDYVNVNYDVVGVKWEKKGGFTNHNRRYLTKIQPPRKEKTVDIRRKHMDTIITHAVYPGDIHYKGRVIPGFYQETTGNFYPSSEWEPVEEWVTIEVMREQWDNVNTRDGAFEAWGFDGNYHTIKWRTSR